MNPLLSTAEWHARFEQQARWTQELRHYLYRRAGIAQAQRVLDLGCGTGTLLPELEDLVPGRVTGLDIDAAFLDLAMRNHSADRLVQGDAFRLPFTVQVFSAVVCHFVLLWLPEPLAALREIQRVTQPGGALLALAEPDYGGRIDYPPELEPLGAWQAEALHRQGADPLVGRKLAALFRAAGLEEVKVGVLGGQWELTPGCDEMGSEWSILEADLAGLVPPETLTRLREDEAQARQKGERILFVPTFYAWGRVSR